MSEYGWRIDHGGDVGELFTADGLVLAPEIGLELRGREAIAQHFAARSPPGQVTVHTWSGLRVEERTQHTARLSTIQTTLLRLAGETEPARHLMVGETRDLVRRDPSGDWRFLERRLKVVFPFDVRLAPASATHESGSGLSGALKDGGLYYVKSRSGEVSVARYFARHQMFFAVGDAIGYFAGDLAVGRPVPLDAAFDE